MTTTIELSVGDSPQQHTTKQQEPADPSRMTKGHRTTRATMWKRGFLQTSKTTTSLGTGVPPKDFDMAKRITSVDNSPQEE